MGRDCFHFDTAQERYDRYNTKGLYMKLNLKTDQDIIKWTRSQNNVQGAIKRLIREEIAKATDTQQQ